jgi:D-glycero-alpha-D-manno-heptose-7-phosphate kinase
MKVDGEQLLTIAMNVEAQVINVPTGLQDYRPAYYGGVSAIELRADGVRRVAVNVDPAALQSRLVLAYTGAPHFRNQQLGDHEAPLTAIGTSSTVSSAYRRLPAARTRWPR